MFAKINTFALNHPIITGYATAAIGTVVVCAVAAQFNLPDSDATED